MKDVLKAVESSPALCSSSPQSFPAKTGGYNQGSLQGHHSPPLSQGAFGEGEEIELL